MSKINPTRIQRPSIQKWCYKPEEVSTMDKPECAGDAGCPGGNICENQKCIEGIHLPIYLPIDLEITITIGCRVDADCTGGNVCSNNVCNIVRSFPFPEDKCSIDSQCPAGHICHEEKCSEGKIDIYKTSFQDIVNFRM